MKKEKTTKKKGSVMTTREKMLARKKDLEKRSGGGGIIYPKEGTTRVRIKSREKNKLNWDDKLTLEFNGESPRLNSLKQYRQCDHDFQNIGQYLERNDCNTCIY